MHALGMYAKSSRSYEAEKCHPNSCYTFGDTAVISLASLSFVKKVIFKHSSLMGSEQN